MKASAPAPAAGLSDNLRGALWALGAACGFSVNGALVKSLVQLGFDPLQIAFFRSAIAFLTVLPFVWFAGFDSLRTRHPWLHFFRVLAGGSATICAFYALAHLRLADVTALGPGMTVTIAPASTAAATAVTPGSATTGVPASVTRATSSPCASRSTSSVTRYDSLPTK